MKGGACLALYALGVLIRHGYRVNLAGHPCVRLRRGDREPDDACPDRIRGPQTPMRARSRTRAGPRQPDHGAVGVPAIHAQGQRLACSRRCQPRRRAFAIGQIAAQIPRIEAMSDVSREMSLSVGVVHGGRWVNVVPHNCVADVLVVTTCDEDFHHSRARMGALRRISDSIELEVHVGPVRPLFHPSPNGLVLYERARRLGQCDRVRRRPWDSQGRQWR
jgi:hypothetical protein